MKLLAIETSTEACSVALAVDGDIRERFELAPRGHAERVLPWIDALLADSGLPKTALDAIAVGRGPGAFTGVRLGIAIAQGIGFALERPLLPVSTLAALALGAGAAAGERVLAAIDARMGEVYACGYLIDAAGLPQPLGDEVLLRPEALPRHAAAAAAGKGWIAVGTGFGGDGNPLIGDPSLPLQRCDPDALPRAADVARLAIALHAAGGAVGADAIEPAYLRDKVAQTLAERGKG